MTITYRFKRALVISRRERLARLEELRQQVRTWDFWRGILNHYVFPVAFVLVAWSSGAIWGFKHMAEKVNEQFVCEARHVN